MNSPSPWFEALKNEILSPRSDYLFLGCFLENHEFGRGRGHALSFQEQVTQVLIATAAAEQGLDVPVHGFNHAQANSGDRGSRVLARSVCPAGGTRGKRSRPHAYVGGGWFHSINSR